MKQPWIYAAKQDFIFILLPPFLVLLFVFLYHDRMLSAQNEYSFYTWLFLIVFIDVAHVYSTLFKTYFVPAEFRRRRKLYLLVPFVAFFAGIFLYQFGSLTFWSVLALIAIFHFVRQQYGFMRLYARFEPNDFFKKLDNLAIYSATIYPILFWFSTPRSFNWFVEQEFEWIGIPVYFMSPLLYVYIFIWVVWICKTVFVFITFHLCNLPKTMLILGTYLSWFFGIVYFDNDLIFTLLNVISHGVPYMALIYFNEIKLKNDSYLKKWSFLKKSWGVFLFIGILIAIAFSEEVLWEGLVWKEYIRFNDIEVPDVWLSILVPLLVVPQVSHYILDGFIWKRSK